MNKTEWIKHDTLISNTTKHISNDTTSNSKFFTLAFYEWLCTCRYIFYMYFIIQLVTSLLHIQKHKKSYTLFNPYIIQTKLSSANKTVTINTYSDNCLSHWAYVRERTIDADNTPISCHCHRHLTGTTDTKIQSRSSLSKHHFSWAAK